MPERAEIEAVARALAKLANDTAEQVGMEHDYGWEEYEAEAETAIAALDRVRDARGDDEAARCGCNELLGGHRDECPKWGESPQGENHEAVEDWRTIAVRLASLLRELHPQNPYYREKQAEALAAFDALAGVSNEGGNQ
jgi:hypothetical protein